MLKKHDHSRKIIDTAIITLVLFILALTFEAAWEAYDEYHAASQMDQVNNMADRLLAAANIAAVERGITSSALSAGKTVEQDTLLKIAEVRKSGDELWSGALQTAHELARNAPGNSEFHSAIQTAEQEYAELQQTRKKIDDCLASKPCQCTAMAWLKQMTRFIVVSSRLRELIFLPLDSPRHVAQFNILIKRWVWLASEHAGRERGTLVYFINAGMPLPVATLDELKANWGVVERNILDIQSVAELQTTDPRIVQAVQDMELSFQNDYARLRQQVYRDTATGHYSLDGRQWFEASTLAIGSILNIASAVTVVTDEYAKQSLRASYFHMARHGLLLLATFVIAGWSLTKVRQTAAQLFKQKELAEVTLHSIGDAVVTTDANGLVEYINPVAEELTGWKNVEAQGRPISEICVLVNGGSGEPEENPIEKCLHDKQVVGLAVNVLLKSRKGEDFVIEDSAAPIRDREGNIVGAVMVFYDVTLNREGAHLLSYHATHDSLTGLVNRREFERRLLGLHERAKKYDLKHAFCYMDLDQFKIINDTCGHIVGDKLLRQLAYLLQESMRDSDTLARLGGDEFGVLLENCPLDRAMHIAEKIREVIKEFRFTWEGKSYELGVSIGLVQIEKDSVSTHELMREADAACYAAKDKGRNRVQVYRPDNLELAKRHGEMQWVGRIKEALEQNRFCLYCQPIYALKYQCACHLEILLRLQDEQGNIIAPLAFIPAAERYGLMPEIDRWVVRTALETLKAILEVQDLQQRILCNINLSGASLGEEGFAAYLMEQIENSGLPAAAICFEITETAAVSNFEVASELMKNLKKRGCRLALDDFGSGLSSFAYLKAFPVDFLKIDGSFVKHIADDPVAYAMVQSINTVGHVMGIETIAEYVENQAVYDKLLEMDVDFAQGYFIEKPMPLEEFLTYCPRVEKRIKG